jgi:hypothetical protein
MRKEKRNDQETVEKEGQTRKREMQNRSWSRRHKETCQQTYVLVCVVTTVATSSLSFNYLEKFNEKCTEHINLFHTAIVRNVDHSDK